MKADLTPVLLAIEQSRYASCSSYELLVGYYAARDEGAFRALVEREGPSIYAICYGESGRGETAAEAFQETFLVLVRKGHMIRDEAKLQAWLRQVARRTARRMASRSFSRRRAEASHAREAAGGESTTPDDALAALEQSSRVWCAARMLPDRYRTPLELRYLAGMSPPEIARRLGVPEKTVKTRLLRALKKLRPALRRLGLGAAALGTADGALIGAMPLALIAGTTEFVARGVQESGPKLASGLAGFLLRWRWVAGAALLVAVVVGVARFARDQPAPVVVPPPMSVVVDPDSPEILERRRMDRAFAPAIVEMEKALKEIALGNRGGAQFLEIVYDVNHPRARFDWWHKQEKDGKVLFDKHSIVELSYDARSDDLDLLLYPDGLDGTVRRIDPEKPIIPFGIPALKWEWKIQLTRVKQAMREMQSVRTEYGFRKDDYAASQAMLVRLAPQVVPGLADLLKRKAYGNERRTQFLRYQSLIDGASLVFFWTHREVRKGKVLYDREVTISFTYFAERHAVVIRMNIFGDRRMQEIVAGSEHRVMPSRPAGDDNPLIPTDLTPEATEILQPLIREYRAAYLRRIDRSAP